ncbi:MAG TPA: hypothetical protein VH374_09860 [Polyangia bacterium]|jgi:hypothetical protein|nr:hypothetical protein [Polyangia bacterium]
MRYRTLGSFSIAIALAVTHVSVAALAADKKPDKKPDEEEKKGEDVPEVVHDQSAWEVPQDQLIPAQPQRVPTYGAREDWSIQPFGFAKLDMTEDSTQSLDSNVGGNMIQRVGTYKGDHRRTTLTARDSRVGLQFLAPSFPDITPKLKGMRTSGLIEFDFFGLTPTDAKRSDVIIYGPVRMRQAYLKLETYVIDVIAGQTQDLFGWGGYFYPATVAYLGVPGQIYHRNPQLRLEEKLRSDDGNYELVIAAAAVEPAQRDSGIPEGQAGIKFAYKGWKGWSGSGFGSPYLVPLSIGVSGMYRHFEVPAFRPSPGSEAVTANGYGAAASILLPVIPARAEYDRSNALTLTGEFSIGTGIADMYSGMDGGSRFPVVVNVGLTTPAPAYPANVDPGLVTFDRTYSLKTINWRAFVGGLQYYLPMETNRIWVTGIYSRVWSDNIKTLTPMDSFAAIFTKMEYIDANIEMEVTPAVVLGLSFQTVKQTFGDVSSPEPTYTGEPIQPTQPGTGGMAQTARNNRGQLSMAFFF